MGIMKKQEGFTIIEVSMVLAIVGVLAVTIISGFMITINQQRYRDAVNAHVMDFREEYSKVTNVENSRDNTYQCNTGDIYPVASGSIGADRGTTNCVIIGRWIESNPRGFTSRPIYAFDKPVDTREASPLMQYKPQIERDEAGKDPKSVLGRSEATLGWQATYESPDQTKPDDETPQNTYTVAIVRSPVTGSIQTYIMTGQNDASRGTATEFNAAKRRLFAHKDRASGAYVSPEQRLLVCVSPVSTTGGATIGVQIAAGSSTSAGVKLATEDICRK